MPLAIDHLPTFGLPRRAVDVWKAHGMNALLPLQEKALAEHGFLHGKNLLVFAPTSSGKTFIAEMAALRHLEQNHRVIFLVPTKSLAEEKYRDFHALYGRLGYRIAISTRERPDTDQTVLESRYDLLVAVYEKMKAFLITQPEMLGGVALIVADEIQTLGEPGRGATLDLLLTKITKAPYKTQFIGLSAVLGDDAHRLAAWLRCDLLVWRQRPLELREGIYDCSRQTFFYNAFNTGQRGEETFPAETPPEEDDGDGGEETADFRRESLLALAQTLALNHEEQVLIFVPTRYTSRNWAHHLANRAPLPPASRALEELDRYEDTHSKDLLQKTLGHAVAFHNADLGWDLRELVERNFNSGDIRILVSTSTLGQGVNLSGRNVLHVPVMITTDKWTGRAAYAALTRGRFHNQGGRGARFTHAAGFGRSILTARNTLECERLLRDYVDGPLENITPQIQPEHLAIHVLDLIASRIAVKRPAIASFFHDTFTGRTSWPDGSAPISRKVDDAIDEMIQRLLIDETPEGILRATGLGEAAATTGLHPGSVVRIVRWLHESPRALLDDPAEPLLVLAGTPDAHEFPLGPGSSSLSPAAWAEPLRERLLHRAEGIAPLVRETLNPPGGFTRETSQDLKKTLLLDAWIGRQETREIEEHYQIFSGTAANLASHFSWLAQSAAALARALAHPQNTVQALDTLAERLMLGCGPDGLPFRALRVPALSRAYLHALLKEGYNTLESLEEAGAENLSRLLPPGVAEDLLGEIRRMRPRKSADPAPDASAVPGKSASTQKSAGPANASAPARRPAHAGNMANPAPDPRETPAEIPTRQSPPDSSEPEPPGITPPPLSAISTAPSALAPSLDTPALAPAEISSDFTPGALPALYLEIDMRGAGRALFNGREIPLSPRPFGLLCLLARQPETGLSYEELEQNLWTDSQVERQQISAHLKTLREAIARVIGPETARQLLHVKRGRGICLALPPERITFRGAATQK